MELEFGLNIKVVAYGLIFPTAPGLLNLEWYNLSYDFISDRRSVWSFSLKFLAQMSVNSEAQEGSPFFFSF